MSIYSDADACRHRPADVEPCRNTRAETHRDRLRCRLMQVYAAVNACRCTANHGDKHIYADTHIHMYIDTYTHGDVHTYLD